MKLTVGGVFSSFCQFNLQWFPFDIQTCQFVLEAWRYDMSKQFFEAAHFYREQYGKGFEQNEQWDVLDVSAKIVVIKYESGDYDQILYTIVMKRKWAYFGMSSIVPCILIGLIEMATFLLKYNDATRLELSFTCLVAYSMFGMIISGELPRTADKTPLLQLLITLFMVYITLSIILQALCIYIADKANSSYPPTKTMLRCLNPAFCLFRISKSKIMGSPTDWLQIAKCFDRFAMIFIFLLHISTFSTLLTIIVIKSY